MSGQPKPDNSTDTQDTFYDDCEIDAKQSINTAILQESQDFELLIAESADDSLKDKNKNIAEVVPAADATEKVKTEEEIPLEDDDELIQGTPLFSPSENSFLKRKADIVNSDANKISRSSNSDDAFSVDRDKVKNDILAEETAPFFEDSLEIDDIIPETQYDSEVNKITAESSTKSKSPRKEEEKAERLKQETVTIIPESQEDKYEKDKDEGEVLKEVPPAGKVEISNGSQEPKDDKDEEKTNGENVEAPKESKSRMSIEVIYDYKTASQEKQQLMEVVELDENGDEEPEKTEERPELRAQKPSPESTHKLNGQSDKDEKSGEEKNKGESSIGEPEIIKLLTSGTKETIPNKQPIILVNVSDSEGDNSLNLTKSPHNQSLKSLQYEKEICLVVKMKCLVTVDENRRDILQKELISVNCEPAKSHLISDSSTFLGDISGNEGAKDSGSSPGSVTSTVNPFPLPEASRLSIMSTASSSSSGSSAASLAAKMNAKDKAQFSLPRIPRLTKHAKKNYESSLASIAEDKHQYEAVVKEWKNFHLLVSAAFSSANAELTQVDYAQNNSDTIEESTTVIPTSTPEVTEAMSSTATMQQTLQSTPKRAKKGRPSRSARSARSGKSKSGNPENNTPKLDDTGEKTTLVKGVTPERQVKTMTMLRNVLGTPSHSGPADELLGKDCFAMWSDKIYYPGQVVDKNKNGKYKVNFHDGKSKFLIESFIVPVTETLNSGLSIYATPKVGEDASPGIIRGSIDGKEILYVIELDGNEGTIDVPISCISLSSDQMQIMREEMDSPKPKSLPSTPQLSSLVSLDNMLDGTRRSKRLATPSTSQQTPTSSKRSRSRITAENEPSGSGINKQGKDDNRLATSDTNTSEDDKPSNLTGIQQEIISTPNQTAYKSKAQGKSKGKKKGTVSEESIQSLGPIPEEGSTLFQGKHFILACANTEDIDKYQLVDEADSPESEAGTDNEGEWVKVPFIREHLTQQITKGGGQIYENLNDIPSKEYSNTLLITNVPNSTAKALMALSVGIDFVNHKWIIQCCRENKLVSVAQEKLPVGWSLGKKNYVEMYDRPSKAPLKHVNLVLPEVEQNFVAFWKDICEKAGATVKVINGPEESFVEGTVMLGNFKCPAWAVKKADDYDIPVVSTSWIVQCLIEGQLCSYEGHPSFAHTYVRS